MKDTQITIPDGRSLAYTDIGDPNGTCIMHFHGAPSSRLVLNMYDEVFAEYGLRVISADRPGYGGSSPLPGRTLVDWPTDVESLADLIGIDEFVVSGISSGGPYVVACCALIPKRVLGGLVFAGATDMTSPGADVGYPKVELDIMATDNEKAAEAYCEKRFGSDGSGFFEDDTLDWPEPDKKFLADAERSKHIERAMSQAFAQGVTAYAQDVYIQGQPWPFESAAIRCPFRVIHGELDDLAPIAHSEHTAQIIPNADLNTVDGHGHISLLDEMPKLAADFVNEVK